MLENARAAEAADRFAESVEQSTKQAKNSVSKPARKNFKSNMKKETEGYGMKKTLMKKMLIDQKETDNLQNVLMISKLICFIQKKKSECSVVTIVI